MVSISISASEIFLRLFQMNFSRALVLAIIIHVLGLFVMTQEFKPAIVEVPFKSLHIRLGSGTASPSYPAAVERPAMLPTVAIPATPSPVEILPTTLPLPASLSTPNHKAFDKAAPLAPTPLQKPSIPVGPIGPPASLASKPATIPSTSGSPGVALGNEKNSGASYVGNYEQVLSLWMLRHKVYPREARQSNVEGQAILMVQIDREGYVKYYEIVKKTGHNILDDAIRVMVEEANPLPPVPDDYPAGRIVEFLIPISFSLRGTGN